MVQMTRSNRLNEQLLLLIKQNGSLFKLDITMTTAEIPFRQSFHDTGSLWLACDYHGVVM